MSWRRKGKRDDPAEAIRRIEGHVKDIERHAAIGDVLERRGRAAYETAQRQADVNAPDPGEGDIAG